MRRKEADELMEPSASFCDRKTIYAVRLTLLVDAGVELVLPYAAIIALPVVAEVELVLPVALPAPLFAALTW